MKYILSIDQSTTATKAIIFNQKGQLVGRSNSLHEQIYPKSGWVEHNPIEIYKNTIFVIKDVVKKTSINKNDIVAIAITNQRETTMLWGQDGEPICNAIVWQCNRASDIIKESTISSKADLIKKSTGIRLSPYYSSAKAKWICDNFTVPHGTLFGTMDSWLIWKLAGKHLTDYSNASRTQLFNINNNKWDEDIIELFGLKKLKFPEVKSSNEIFGYTTVEGFFDKPIPISGVMGDSHGALFGQKCFEKGMGKATFGTGSSIMINIGDKPKESSNGLVTSIAWALDGKVEYVFEGNINSSGDTIKWLIDGLGLLNNSIESEDMAIKVKDTNGIYLVPAFHGLGAPHWNYDCRALICGITRDSTRNHIVRAALESIAYQVCDIIKAAEKDIRNKVNVINVDGGPTNNDFLMQFVSDIIRANLIKLEIEELSAQGAAFAAGLAVKLWDSKDEIAKLKTVRKAYNPIMKESEAEELYLGWQKALKRTMIDIK